jgi:SpoIIAA-like
MPATIQREHDGVYRLEVSGLLRKPDLDAAQRALLDEIGHAAAGTIRLLVVLDDFEGWEAGAAWNDLTFYVRHGDRLERIAIVGEERWRGHALMFAAADLRRGPVEYFTPDAMAAARAWLTR